MNLLFKFTIGVIIALIFIFLSTFSEKKSYAIRTLILLAVVLIFSLSVLAYYVEPLESTDLFRHFNTIEDMRKYGFNIKTNVDEIFIVKILFGIVSMLDNNYLLATISTIVTTAIFFIIVIAEHKKNKISTAYTQYMILLFFALCNYYYIVTGIKSALAYSFLALSVFLEEKGNKVISKIFMIVSVFTHGSAIFVVILGFLSKIKFFQGKNKYYILLISMLVGILKNLLVLIPIDLFQYIANKIAMYEIKEFTLGNNLILYMNVLFAILMIYRTGKILKSDINKEDRKEILFIQIVSIFSIGSLAISKIIIERMMMFVGFFIPKLIYAEKEKNNNLVIRIFDIVYATGIILYYIVRLTSHTKFRI